MRSRMSRPSRLVALAASMTFSLALAAVPAWADGEDDPTFGNVGTSFLEITDGIPVTHHYKVGFIAPVTDQAPDGAILTATPLELGEIERGPALPVEDVVRVARMDAGGARSGLDGDGAVDVPAGGDVANLLDIEALANGTTVVVFERFDAFEDRGFGLTELVVVTLDAAGQLISDNAFVSPELCDDNDAVPVAADVDAAGRVFVVWDECDEDNVVTRYSGLDELELMLTLHETEDIALGPDGNVYVLGRGCCAPVRGNALTVVVRLSADLEQDPDYGEHPSGAPVDGLPIDLAVGPGGKAVVWSTGPLPGRGQPPETWDMFRFDQAGSPDGGFGSGGHVALQHPELGDELGFCVLGARAFDDCADTPHLIVQGDSKVIAVGNPPLDDFEVPGGGGGRGVEVPRALKDRVIARLTDGGVLDTAWDGDGVRTFLMDQPVDAIAGYLSVGPPALQSDGKLLIPTIAFAGAPAEMRIPAPPIGARGIGLSLGVSRIGLSPATTAAPSPAAVPVVAASRTCVSRRLFRIRLRTGRRRAERSRISSATVTVNGRNVPVTRGARLTSEVNLRNLPRGRFTVVIQLRLADGGRVRDVRRYRTCTRKQARELPALRTRKPKRARRR